MPIVPRPRWRELSSWGVWLVGVLVLLLSPWRARLAVRWPALAACSTPVVQRPVVIEVWQSPTDAWPWFGPRLRARWQAAWRPLRAGLAAVRAWLALLARVWGCRTLADVIAVLTRRSVTHYLGALPVLYLLLEQLRVRPIINRYCPTESPVDHGAVTLVLVLNRLVAPRPLYRVMDWLAQTVLSDALGVPVAKFNDDRLGRTLDALAIHAQAIWQDIASQALVRYPIDLSVVFYDLTALVMSGDYPDSDLADYGFAHNTPSDKQKLKLGLLATADGGLPCVFQPWSGRTADKATVQQNMEALHALLKRHGWNTQQVLVVGDSANLNSQLALAYTDQTLKYLAGLPLVEKVHRALVLAPTERALSRQPLTDDPGPTGYWGRLCEVPFTHQGRTVVHQGLVVLSGPTGALHRMCAHRAASHARPAVPRPVHRVARRAGQDRAEALSQPGRSPVPRGDPTPSLAGGQTATCRSHPHAGRSGPLALVGRP